jgi:protein-tyrosine phosphatase
VAGPRELLVVCTANLCRSPVVAGLLTRKFQDVVDLDGRAWVVASAGTSEFRGAPEPDTLAAAARLGVDISAHVSRRLTAADVAAADLIVTMTREHVREIVANEPTAWPKTFTLKELVRRAMAAPTAIDGFAAWRSTVAADRRAADLLTSSANDDDVVDPFRRGSAANETMVREVDALTDGLISWGPWRRAQPNERSVSFAE